VSAIKLSNKLLFDEYNQGMKQTLYEGRVFGINLVRLLSNYSNKHLRASNSSCQTAAEQSKYLQRFRALSIVQFSYARLSNFATSLICLISNGSLLITWEY